MSRTPSQGGAPSGMPSGSDGAGRAKPQRAAAYPSSKPAAPAGAAGIAVPLAKSAPAPSARPAASSATTSAPASQSAPVGPPAPADPPAPGGKSVSGPPAAPAKIAPFSPRNLIMGGSAAGVLLLLVVLLLWRPWSPSPPRLNEHPTKIAKFATSSALEKLPFSQQREYMDILDDKDDAVVQAYESGKLSDREYRRALQLGWYAKHLDRMDKFFNRPPGMRLMYVDEKVLGKKLKKKKNDIPAAAGKGKEVDEVEKSDDLSALRADEIDRDDSTEEQDIKKWPADVRQKWAEYRHVLSVRKDFFKDLEKKEKERRKAAEAKADANAGKAGTGGGAAQEPPKAETSE